MAKPPSHFRKTASGFQPISQYAREFHSKTKLGQVVEMRCRRPRSPGHHRKLFALLNILVENTEDFTSTEDALTAIKAATGHGRWVKIGKAQRELFIPESISFDAMCQSDFNSFYDRAIAAVLRFWLSGVEEPELREAIEGFAV